MRYLIDTNVVLRWSDNLAPEYQECQDAVAKSVGSGHIVCCCAQVFIEYWVVATRPAAVNGLGLTFDQACSSLSDIDKAFIHLPEPPDIAARWANLVMRQGIMGKQAHDARIAALMLAHGVTHLLTLNPSDFVRYTGIVPVTPSQILQST